MNGGTSADDLLATLNEHRKSDPVRNSSAFDLSRMLDPSSSLVQDSTRGMMAGLQRDITSAKTERMKMKLNPSTGRSVSIGMGIDVGRGFRLLEQSCARNKVRSDANKQRFHERGGLKRKRLRRERWRKRFMEGFKATVGRVKQLKNQGW